MSDRELRAVLADLAELSPEELDEVTDARAFAVRLASLALGDLTVPRREKDDPDPIDFHMRPSKPSQDLEAGERGHTADSRIYAFFPTHDYHASEVLVRWLQGSPPEVLRFDRHPIEPGAPNGYVWLRPKDEWTSGRYQVDIYSADEDLNLLARGWYAVD